MSDNEFEVFFAKAIADTTKYHEHQHYEPYCNDRKFMEREGEPCRLCLYPFHEHHNGRCPKDDEENTDG